MRRNVAFHSSSPENQLNFGWNENNFEKEIPKNLDFRETKIVLKKSDFILKKNFAETRKQTVQSQPYFGSH